MEFEQLEALAFGSDRSPQAAQLVRGTPDYDYFTCLRLQQRGEFAQAQRIIDGWAASHGEDDLLNRLQQRQLLARWHAAPTDAALAREVADLLNIDHTHEPQDRVADAALPSSLDNQTLSPKVLLTGLVLEDRTLATATDYALPRLLDHKLTQAQRQTMLDRLGPSQTMAVVDIVVEDVQRHGLGSFGGRPMHNLLSRAQLDEVARRIVGLAASLPWWCARWMRMRPPSFVQWSARSAARSEYLIAVYQDMATLPEPFRIVKFWALAHLLAEELLHGRRHDQWFLEYVDLRNADLALERKHPDDGSRRANVQQAATALGLEAYVSVDIVGVYLAAYVANNGSVPAAVAARFDRAWLERCLAEQRLLAGKSQSDADAVLLGASAVAALAAQTVLEVCPHNPVTYAADAAVTVDVDVKNIDRVTVKAYRIDPVAYFAATGRAVGIDLDLDGITASYERIETISRPPIERVRRSFAVPPCTRPGTYIVEFIGGGIASRTLIHKGRLRCVTRPSCAGTVITVFDQAGQPGAHERTLEAGPENGAHERTLEAGPENGAHERTLEAGPENGAHERTLEAGPENGAH
ncbi:MAG: hypothetical protein KBG15_03680, partial [Kofleriaceae bacterium]|nr:hypothetical protein [Kofleriaceae bacterium]